MISHLPVWDNIKLLLELLEDEGFEHEWHGDRYYVQKEVGEFGNADYYYLGFQILPAALGLTNPGVPGWIEIVNTSLCLRHSTRTEQAIGLMQCVLDAAMDVGGIVLCGPVRDGEQYWWIESFNEVGWIENKDGPYPVTIYYPEGETDDGE